MPTTQISEGGGNWLELRKIDHFQDMLDMPCGLLLLPAPVLWLSGLPCPPEDSLRVPCDGGLLTPFGPLAAANRGPPGGSILISVFESFRPSAAKLPTTTCNGFRIPESLALLRSIICTSCVKFIAWSCTVLILKFTDPIKKIFQQVSSYHSADIFHDVNIKQTNNLYLNRTGSGQETCHTTT